MSTTDCSARPSSALGEFDPAVSGPVSSLATPAADISRLILVEYGESGKVHVQFIRLAKKACGADVPLGFVLEILERSTARMASIAGDL